MKFKTIIADEATKINNPETQMYRALMKIPCEKRLALTGTPISNSPLDAYGLLNWLSPGYVGNFYTFKDSYCITDDRFNNIVGFKNLDKLSDKVNRFMLRRKKEEVFKDLPPKVIENIVFPISDSEKIFYKAIKEQVISEIQKLSEMDTRNLNIMVVKMIRLRQCADHPRLVGYDTQESSKLEALLALLEPIITSSGKAIVFTEFAQMLHILVEELGLKKYKVFSIYGEVDSINRMVQVKAFNDFNGPAIMCMTSAGAYGLNLASASYIIHYDLPFSIAKLEQREGRADRSADTNSKKLPLTIYTLTAKNTIDEYLLKIINKKNRISVDILKDAERMEESGISREDIEDILRL